MIHLLMDYSRASKSWTSCISFLLTLVHVKTVPITCSRPTIGEKYFIYYGLHINKCAFLKN